MAKYKIVDQMPVTQRYVVLFLSLVAGLGLVLGSIVAMYVGINERPYDLLCISGSREASQKVTSNTEAKTRPLRYLISNLHLDGAL